MKPARITFTATQGSLEGNVYVFEEPCRCVIGRAVDCEIHVPRDYGQVDVSRHHCLLEIDPPDVWVRDLGSCNGTYVNDEKIGQRPDPMRVEDADIREYPAHELKDGDELRLGNTVFRVRVAVPSDMPEHGAVPLFFV